jgi:hypothetical protein
MNWKQWEYYSTEWRNYELKENRYCKEYEIDRLVYSERHNE